TVDTTLAASAIVMALQSVVSRNTDPQQPLVVSVTSFRTESDAFNVIPEHVTLRGTVRSFDMDVRARTIERIEALATLTAQSYGATATFGFDEEPYPVMVNHDTETDHCISAAREVAGTCITDAPRTTGGEDFAYMLRACPGAYIQLGIGEGPGLHHPAYDFNDDVIPTGCSYWVSLAEQRLPA
ncbi:MAG: M20/M25/M40 family metallo-hydrolase, partial [Pseudomonadota bacterium]